MEFIIFEKLWMVKCIVKEKCIIKIILLCMKVILWTINLKVMENLYKEGVYYVDQILKGEKHDKGILYDKNGDIVYEGNCINDKIKGEGKIIDTDDYYIGQFEDGKKKGKEFYKD